MDVSNCPIKKDHTGGISSSQESVLTYMRERNA
jgi:hypothetical protein